jgi:hypothetical protein
LGHWYERPADVFTSSIFAELAAFQEHTAHANAGCHIGDDSNFFLSRCRACDSEAFHSATASDMLLQLQALLQVGFKESEFREIQAFMNSMDAQMVALHSADESALRGRLCDAFEGEQGYREAPEGTKRAIIMSGMYTSEVLIHRTFWLVFARKLCCNSHFTHLTA